MKKLIALGLAVFLGACAANANDGNEEANSGAAAATANATGPTIAQCANRKACVDSVVLRAVLSSDLRLNRQPDQILQSTLAREAVAEWLAKNNNDGRLEITVQRGAGGNWDVMISMIAGHETKNDEGDAMAMNFQFTMDATNRIIENIVDTALAG